jgi:predicted O-methyltransferase YrrM
MEHFYQNIEGWFSYEYLYKHVVEQAKDGALFVEVGSFKGRSSAYLATQIVNSGKKIQLDLVDTWQGSTEHQAGGDCEVKEVVEGTLYETFLNNMKPVEGHYRAVRMTSLEAAEQYEDNSIDFIMIDGEHSLEAVTNDIRAFLPKMKSGGIMTGDDAQPWNPVREAAVNELTKYGVTFPTNGHFYAVITK